MVSTNQGSQGDLGSAAFSNKELVSLGLSPIREMRKMGLEKQFLDGGGSQHLGEAYLNPLGDFKICGLLHTFTHAMR